MTVGAAGPSAPLGSVWSRRALATLAAHGSSGSSTVAKCWQHSNCSDYQSQCVIVYSTHTFLHIIKEKRPLRNEWDEVDGKLPTGVSCGGVSSRIWFSRPDQAPSSAATLIYLYFWFRFRYFVWLNQVKLFNS